GLAAEGGAAAMQFAFERLNLSHLSSIIQPLNRASIRVAEKLDMTQERIARLNGIDVLIYGCDRS
ncbi:MAG TPA: GNAT family N-acetyltransferase, partial [Planctomycetaceae bacterium]|nr:GNAT family N-acetyltransferase [Planctomycetaceae bacterium]